MSIEDLDGLEASALLTPVRQKEMSLWVLPGVSVVELEAVLRLPWVNIWDASPDIDVEAVWSSAGDGRRVLSVTRPEQDYASYRVSEFVRIFDVSPGTVADRRQQRFVERLKDRVEDISGILCFIGPAGSCWSDLSLARDLAPGIPIVILNTGGLSLPGDAPGEFLRWSRGLAAFTSACHDIVSIAGDPSVVNLKDAPGVRVDERLLEDVSSQWTFLSDSLTLPPERLTQGDFDAFLNGDDAWPAIAAGVPFRRKHACFKCATGAATTERQDFVQIVIERAMALERASLNPQEQLEQILVFSESGSGVTTLLRQTAMALAQRGLPTLISKPFPRDFGGRSLEEFIIDLQDRWLRNRRGKGSGSGLIPVCLLTDTDGEAVLGESGLARSLQALGRKILLVRALDRSGEEIARARGPLAMRAEVDSDELVALGAHLRSIADSHGLERMPSDEEWRAFHEGMRSLTRYTSYQTTDGGVLTPPLFLIGISPFVKERISDENSLEQYYYRKWQELDNRNAQEIVRVISAAGVYGLSVPFDTVRRHPKLDVLLLNSLGKTAKRTLDIFVHWSQRGQDVQEWFLHMRHAAIATILSRMIDPTEGDFPHTPILPLLEHLSTKDTDLWFARTLAFRLGQFFKSRSPRFTLETDTVAQRAARAVFNAIPQAVKAVSRTVRHHQGRYHIHVLRSCNECLQSPQLTSLDRPDVVRIAKREFESATEYLEMATQIREERESISHIYNTLATAQFALAETLQTEEPSAGRDAFDRGLDYEERALKHDAGNGHALYQYVKQIIESATGTHKSDFERDVEMLSRAELRLVELIRLHEEKRWRNVDPVEAERQLGGLVQDYLSIVKVVCGKASGMVEFEAQHPEAILFLRVRELIQGHSLEASFLDPATARRLRELRDELSGFVSRSSRSDLYLYRLFLSDREGRLEYKTRFEILQKVKREDREQFSPFAHDEAALYCQLDQLDLGAQKLAELRQYRRYSRDQWFWLNERALLDSRGSPTPRELTLQVSDAVGGWATVLNTKIRVKYQGYQFGEMKREHVFKAFIRFTLNGLQAVPKQLILRDLEEMGLA